MNQELQIRSSAAEFLIFQTQEQGNGIQVYYKNETVWLSQKAMAALFDCSTDNIGLHLKNIFAAGELDKNSVTEFFSATASDGKNCKVRCVHSKELLEGRRIKDNGSVGECLFRHREGYGREAYSNINKEY